MDIGRSLTWQGKYELALVKFLEGRALYQKTKNQKGLATTLNAMAVIYGQFNEDYESALNTFKEALKINTDLGDTLAMARVMQNMGQIYELTQRFDSALFYLKASNSISRQFQDYRSLAVGSNLLGAVFFTLDELDSSEYHYEEAIRLDRQNQDSIGLIFDFGMLSSTLIRKKDFEKAKYYAEEAYKRTKDLGVKFDAAKNLSLIYEAQGDIRKALSYQKEFKTLEDSVRSRDQRELVSELQAKYETTKKEAEIERLSLENGLKDANLARSRNAQYAIGIGGALSIILLIVFFTLRHKKQLAEKQAQELQYDALQKRYIEMLNGPQTFALADDIEALNKKVVNPLTEREFETLTLGLKGKSNREIAEKLFVSESTVKFHLRNVYGKLGVANRKEALEYVVKSS
ncbi:MAG: tetratricopeptide repeat protein [Cyclobacteriaceae bacterium]